MPTRHEAPTGAPIWILLQTTDEPRARSFYGEVFGWTATEANPAFGGYFTFLAGDDPVAGCSEHDPGEVTADRWVTYLASSDAWMTTKAAAASGGQVLVEPTQINVQGTMAVVTDPGGATVGVWTPDQHRGFARYGEPGTPGWFDLETREYRDVVEFYTEVFGWTTEALGDTDSFRYTTLKIGDERLAGILDASARGEAGEPPSWTVVFSVEDTDATVGRILELGGGVLRPASDAPWGRLATTTDPMGARFALVSGA